jgi:methionyl-tRNA formyltransferase
MKTTLDDVGLILAPTFRSRAYAQLLAALGLRPSVAFLIPGADADWRGAKTVEVALRSLDAPLRFEPGMPARETVAAAGWPAVELPEADINSAANVAAIGERTTDVLIYSGLAKALLKPPLLALGIRFLHAHGGFLPAYRGSTSFYYGLLKEKRIGVSAIWIDDHIDTGPIALRDWYDPQPGIEVDRIFEPLARADVIARVLLHRLKTGEFPATPQSGPGELYFVIHPVLKHLALRRIGPRMDVDDAAR